MTVCSASCSASLFHPAASHGVRAVSSAASLVPCCHDPWSSANSPSSHLTPFKAFPSPTAAPRHRDPFPFSLLGLPSVSIRSSLNLKVLLHRRVRCLPLAFPPMFGPMLSWAWFLFKVLPPSRLPIWTTPERSRRSGVALGHVHRSDRALDVALAEAIARQARSLPTPASTIRKWFLQCPRCFHPSHRPADLHQPAIGLSEPTSRAFFPSRSDSVGILTTTGSCFRGHLRKKWRWFHVSPNLGHECLKSLARPKTHRFHRSDHNSHFVSPKTNYLKHSLGFASKWCCRPAETV
jgi:hypothetical protein